MIEATQKPKTISIKTLDGSLKNVKTNKVGNKECANVMDTPVKTLNISLIYLYSLQPVLTGKVFNFGIVLLLLFV